MVTDRDKIALDFLEQFKVATPKQISQVAYDGNLKICYNRLNKLHDDNLIYKTPNKIGKGFIYSTNRIRTLKQFMHNSIRTNFYLKLRECSCINVCVVEQSYGNIRPDLVIAGVNDYEAYFFLVEVETNANHSSVNYDKYNNFFLQEWGKHFKVKPTIIYITDKKIDGSKMYFDYKYINTDLSNFNDIFQ